MQKTDENKITVAELLLLPDKERNKKIEGFYKDLRKALPAPSKLVLPYTSNKQKRKEALVSRVLTLDKSAGYSHVGEELDSANLFTDSTKIREEV